MFKCTLQRLSLVSAKGLRQDAQGGRLTECEGAFSMRVTCLAYQSAPMTAFQKKKKKKRFAGLANCKWKGIAGGAEAD